MSHQRCPSCGGENGPEATYCNVCGGELTAARIDTLGRVLFFSTPFVFLLLGMAFAWDMGIEDPVPTGTAIGLSFLTTVFLVAGGGSWIICRIFGFPFSATFPWRAGMFGTLELIATAILALPLQEHLIPGGLASLTFAEEEKVKIGLVCGVYLPLLLCGLTLIIWREGQTGEASPREGGFRRLGRFGASPVFLGTLLGSIALVVMLPIQQREFLFARIAADFNKTDQALQNLDRALQATPDYPAALYLKGLLLFGRAKDREEGSEAIALMRKAAQLDPKSPRYLLGQALALDQQGRSAEAEDLASRAVDLKAFDPSLWTTLADLRLKAGARDRAVAAYRMALQLDPEDARNLNNLAYTLLEMNSELGTALELARNSVAKQPGYLYNLDTLAWAQYKNGLAGEAFQTMVDLRESAGSVSAEIDLHYAVISQEMGILPNPRDTFEGLWQRQEVQSDPALRTLVTAAIASLGVTIRTVEAGSGSASLPAELGPMPPKDGQNQQNASDGAPTDGVPAEISSISALASAPVPASMTPVALPASGSVQEESQ